MIVNGGFEDDLRGWHVVSGGAFVAQPVLAGSILAQDVRVDGFPVVSLGGDYWHVPYPLGHEGDHLVRSVGRYSGVLESDVFEISLPYLAFRVGGNDNDGAAIELCVPAAWAVDIAGFPPLDAADADGFVAVRRSVPTGSDVLHEVCWELGGDPVNKGLLGAPAKIRLRVDDGRHGHRLLADHFRLLPDLPPPFHPPLWGWADLHCHPMAQAGFGGLLAGHMHGPVEDLGSCVLEHGVDHQNPAHLLPFMTESGHRSNDGSLVTTGWAMQPPVAGEQLGFRGWPAFDDLTHIKVHQDWLRRAYDGGQRLMVALVVHSELLADVMLAPQTDRDTVEPQVQILREFVAHNRAWCGLATTPGQARTLIEGNKLAFVLGLETDSVNGWIDPSEFSSDPGPVNREAIHAVLHDYFGYLRTLGIVQINLLHLSDNAFGGMALYDFMFIVNSWWRSKQTPKRMPTTEDGFDQRPAEDQISRKVSTESTVWGHLDDLAVGLGFPPLSATQGPWTPNGHRNAAGLTIAGEVAVLEAMRLGMVIDLDHMSERSAEDAHTIATTQPHVIGYPLVSAHNGARRMAPRALDPSLPTPPTVPPGPSSEFRRGSHAHPNENAKSNQQLQWIKDTNGIFGHGTAGADSRTWGSAVANDCPGSDKTFAQGYQYVNDTLGPDIGVGLGTDWNSLLEGPGPRFGPRAASGLVAEAEATAPALRASVLDERRAAARAQKAGVLYATPLSDWRKHRFADPALYVGTPIAGQGHLLWQVMAILEAGVTVRAADALETLDQLVREIVLGIRGQASNPTTPEAADYHRVGALLNDPAATAPMLQQEPARVRDLVTALREIAGSWAAMRTAGDPATPAPPQSVPLSRSTAGPIRDFDYNLDGLAHYGMLPDMFQDLRNVGFPAMDVLFASAERYIAVWEASDTIGAALPH